MSMHLVGPELTTTSYKKRKQKITKAQQVELEQGWRERNQRLKEIHLPKESFEEYMEWVYGRGKKAKRETHPGKKITKTSATAAVVNGPNDIGNTIRGDKTSARLDKARAQETFCSVESASKLERPWITGACSSKPSPTYTGTKIIGIGTMHKSNAVPIFSDEEAKDISSMRR